MGKWTLPIAAVMALAAAGCGNNEAHKPASEPERVSARLAVAERVERPLVVELSGSVEAERVAAISTRVMAQVTAIRAQLGERVGAGQVLVEIDPTTTEGQAAQARGALAQAQAGLALAERNFQRFQALAEQKAASELELDLARMQYEQAKGAVEQARGAVEAASSVARESRVVAPFAGRVAAKLVEVGDLAAPGRPLLMLESERGRRFAFALPEDLARRAALEPGAMVVVRLDAYSSLGELPARIVELSPGPDAVSHSFTVKADLGRAEVPAGAAGRVRLESGHEAAVLVPATALLTQGGLDLVVVRDEQGRSQTRVVTVGGRLADGRVEILSGLSGGETVLLDLAAAPAAGAVVESQG